MQQRAEQPLEVLAGSEALVQRRAQARADEIDGQSTREGVDRVLEHLADDANSDHLEGDSQEAGPEQSPVARRSGLRNTWRIGGVGERSARGVAGLSGSLAASVSEGDDRGTEDVEPGIDEDGAGQAQVRNEEERRAERACDRP